MKAVTLFAFALGVAWPACTPSPVVPPNPDASDAAPPPAADGAPSTPCVAACAELAALGCPEATYPNCVQVLAHIDGDRLVRTSAGTPMSCAGIAAATTVAQVRAAGIGCSDAGP